MKKVLVTGANGQLGQCFKKASVNSTKAGSKIESISFENSQQNIIIKMLIKKNKSM